MKLRRPAAGAGRHQRRRGPGRHAEDGGAWWSAPSCASSRCWTTARPPDRRCCARPRATSATHTRRRGTVGGSLAFAAPWAELPAVASRSTPRSRPARRAASRSVAARDFFRDAHATALEPDELVVRALPGRCPSAPAPPGTRSARATATTRRSARPPSSTLDAGGSCSAVELCWCACRARRTGRRPSLVGTRLEDEALDGALASLDGLRRRTTSRPRAAYRRRVAPVLARRALRDAADTPRGTAGAHEPRRVDVRIRSTAGARGGVEPRRTLADLLREELGLKGTHLACEHGFCGSCNVAPRRPHVRSCLCSPCRSTAARATVEALAEPDGTLSPLQQAFTDHPASSAASARRRCC